MTEGLSISASHRRLRRDRRLANAECTAFRRREASQRRKATHTRSVAVTLLSLRVIARNEAIQRTCLMKWRLLRLLCIHHPWIASSCLRAMTRSGCPCAKRLSEREATVRTRSGCPGAKPRKGDPTPPRCFSVGFHIITKKRKAAHKGRLSV